MTAGLATTAAGELLPPLLIFSSTAEKEENMTAKDEWLVTFEKTKGKYGHRNFIERLPYIAVRKSRSMDLRLFMEMTKEVTFDLCPRETVSLAIKIDKHGRLKTGPVMWTADTGPGRLTSVEGELGKEWDRWSTEMLRDGIILNGLLPNSTEVTAVTDELFNSFKCATRGNTHNVFACKIKANAKTVGRRKLDIAKRLAEGLEVPPKEQEQSPLRD